MRSVNISLPDPLKEFGDDRIAERRYRRVSEHIHELIQNNEKRDADQRLAPLLIEGLESDESELMLHDLGDIRKVALARLVERPNKKG